MVVFLGNGSVKGSAAGSDMDENKESCHVRRQKSYSAMNFKLAK